jgi:hypothetical protein
MSGPTIRYGLALALLVAPFPVARAQAWTHPSFQVPRVVGRDFTGALADADKAGKVVLFQWREGINATNQLSVDLGVADPRGEGSNFLLLGGQYGYQLDQARPEMPFDLLLTGGVFGAFGRSQSLFRIPFGLSAGHRFGLGTDVSITPYAHPRVALERCTDCESGGGSATDLSLQIDLGVELALTRSMAVRASALFGTSESTFGERTAFGLAFTYAPAPLSALRR